MCQFFCTHDLVHKARAKLADFRHSSYFLGELYNNVPYKNDKTVDYYLIIYILIIYIVRPFINAHVFIGTRRKCAAATVYKRLDPYLFILTYLKKTMKSHREVTEF